jgi:hypothetical protein
MMSVRPGIAALVAFSSLVLSLPTASMAQSESSAPSPRGRVTEHEGRGAASVEVISSVQHGEKTFQVLSITKGDASWFEIVSLTGETSKPTKIFQDTVLFTNDTNNGGPAVPRDVKEKLAEGFAKRAIDNEGGVEKFSKSLESYATYGVPLPTGLYREALRKQGVTFPSK